MNNKKNNKFGEKAVISFKGKDNNHDFFIAADKLTLDEWLILLKNPPKKAITLIA